MEKRKAIKTDKPVVEMTEAEMKKYTAAELERLMPKRYNRYGYWYYSKDSDAWKVTTTDIRAVMR